MATASGTVRDLYQARQDSLHAVAREQANIQAAERLGGLVLTLGVPYAMVPNATPVVLLTNDGQGNVVWTEMTPEYIGNIPLPGAQPPVTTQAHYQDFHARLAGGTVPPPPNPPPAPAAPTLKLTPLYVILAFVALEPLLLIGALVWWGWHSMPQPAPSPLPAAVKEYQRTLPTVFQQIEQGITNGTIPDKATVTSTMKNHSLPIATALDASLKPFVDPTSGKITNTAGAAAVFHDAYKALGGQ